MSFYQYIQKKQADSAKKKRLKKMASGFNASEQKIDNNYKVFNSAEDVRKKIKIGSLEKIKNLRIAGQATKKMEWKKAISDLTVSRRGITLNQLEQDARLKLKMNWADRRKFIKWAKDNYLPRQIKKPSIVKASPERKSDAVKELAKDKFVSPKKMELKKVLSVRSDNTFQKKNFSTMSGGFNLKKPSLSGNKSGLGISTNKSSHNLTKTESMGVVRERPRSLSTNKPRTTPEQGKGRL